MFWDQNWPRRRTRLRPQCNEPFQRRLFLLSTVACPRMDRRRLWASHKRLAIRSRFWTLAPLTQEPTGRGSPPQPSEQVALRRWRDVARRPLASGRLLARVFGKDLPGAGVIKGREKSF